MFERFTPEARAVLARAQEEARSLRHGYLGTEHVLLGLAAGASGPAVDALEAAGADHHRLRQAVVSIVGTGHETSVFDAQDAEALASLGIDVDAVRARVEEVFGAGALDMPAVVPPPRRRRLRWPRRSSTCAQVVGAGRRPLTPRTKKVLELSLRESLALHHDSIGPEHVLLGIIREGEGLAALLLEQAGIHLQDLRRDIINRTRDVA